MKYRILHIIYSLNRGGAERLIETTVRFSDPSTFDHSVCSLTDAGRISESISREGGDVYTMRKKRKLDPFFFSRLVSLIRKGRFDLLHLHNLPGNLYGTSAHLISRSPVPIIRTEHGYLVHSRYPGFYKHLYVILSRRSEKIICVCDDLRDTLAERFPSLTDKFVTIRNGIPAEDYSDLPPVKECREFFGLPPDSQIIGTAGRLSREKNQIELIRAFKRVSNINSRAFLAILGNGRMRDQLAAAAAEMGVKDRVSLLSGTEHINKFYGGLDLFTLTSTSEGIPLTLLEAMACGLPAVAPAVGGIPEVIEDSLSGYFYPPGNEAVLADRIMNILSDPGRAGRMGMRGKKIVHEDFSAGRFASEQDELYLGALENPEHRTG